MSAIAMRPPVLGELKDDTRGAVMVMGLFMATFLIGSMWFMKGIGDAVVFKDRMQEAADHAVFTGAVVHARGMNVVAALNLIMYVIAFIWVILCVLKDFLDFAVLLLTPCSVPPLPTAVVCAPLLAIASPANRAVTVAKNIYEASAVNVGLPALSLAGTAAAIGYPWYGTYAGYSVGSDYNTMTMVAGPSNIPGFTFKLPLDKFFSGGKPPAVPAGGAAPAAAKPTSFNMKLGLPVTLAKNSELCERFTGSLKSFFPGFIGSVVSWVGGRFVEARGYCKGGVWENEMLGWKKMYSPAENGNDWLQVWAFNFPNEYKENNAESKVALAMGPKFGVPAAVAARGAVPPPAMYNAQAEFYYDCENTWKNDACNGDSTTGAPKFYAVFNMRWMARMRRLKTPNLGGMLFGAISNLFLGPVIDFVGGKLGKALKGTDTFKRITEAMGKTGGDLLGAAVDKTIKDGAKTATSAINKAIGVSSPVGAVVPTSIH